MQPKPVPNPEASRNTQRRQGDRLWRTTTSRNERVADVADAEAAARESENADIIAWMTFDVKARHNHRDDIVSPF